MQFLRPEHEIIVDLLNRMDGSLLAKGECWFGGGTAIVLRLGEYRRSLDVDFLCSSTDGYRIVRTAVAESGVRALFPEEAEPARDPRMDQYGIRLFLTYRDQPIKFELVREARIDVGGALDPVFGVPTLSPEDMFAEKLLANADRCVDRSVAYRDALDLGKLVEAYRHIPDSALAKAMAAYGTDIERKLVWAVNKLTNQAELRGAAEKLDMDYDGAFQAIECLRADCRRIWPSAEIEASPSRDNGNHF